MKKQLILSSDISKEGRVNIFKFIKDSNYYVAHVIISAINHGTDVLLYINDTDLRSFLYNEVNKIRQKENK